MKMKTTINLTEHEDCDTYKEMLAKAREYGERAYFPKEVRHQFKAGKKVVFRRVRTPEKIDVMYLYVRTDDRKSVSDMSLAWFSFLVVSGKEGKSFVCSLNHLDDICVIKSHAISRYIERHGFDGTREECENHIMKSLVFTYHEVEKITNELTMYLDDGLLLGSMVNDIRYFNTYIHKNQMFKNQQINTLYQKLIHRDAVKEIHDNQEDYFAQVIEVLNKND